MGSIFMGDCVKVIGCVDRYGDGDFGKASRGEKGRKDYLLNQFAEQTKGEYPIQIIELSKFSEHLGETLTDGLIAIIET